MPDNALWLSRSDISDGVVGAESGGNDGDLNAIIEADVFTHSHDDVHLIASLALDVIIDFSNFIKGDLMLIGPGNNQKQDMICALNVVVIE